MGVGMVFLWGLNDGWSLYIVLVPYIFSFSGAVFYIYYPF